MTPNQLKTIFANYLITDSIGKYIVKSLRTRASTYETIIRPAIPKLIAEQETGTVEIPVDPLLSNSTTIFTLYKKVRSGTHEGLDDLVPGKKIATNYRGRFPSAFYNDKFIEFMQWVMQNKPKETEKWEGLFMRFAQEAIDCWIGDDTHPAMGDAGERFKIIANGLKDFDLPPTLRDLTDDLFHQAETVSEEDVLQEIRLLNQEATAQALEARRKIYTEDNVPGRRR